MISRMTIGKQQSNTMKILLADDHLLFVEGIVAILGTYRPDITVVSVHSGGVVVDEIFNGDYDLVLLDLRLPQLSGFDVLKKLQQSATLTPVIILSASENPVDMQQAVALGARAFISKKSSAQQILAVIDRVMHGEVVLRESEQACKLQQEEHSDWGSSHGITARQLEVLRLMKHGLSNTAIAQQLSISQATVKTHVAAIFETFNASSRSEAVDKAQLLGLD